MRSLSPPLVVMALLFIACRHRTLLEETWHQTHDKGAVFAVLRAASPGPPDAAAVVSLRRWFARDPDDLWLATTLATTGAEPLWPASALRERRSRAEQGGWRSPVPICSALSVTAEGRPVEACYIEGRSDERALVIGGVHGSEASGIEAVEALLCEHFLACERDLSPLSRVRAPSDSPGRGDAPYFTTIVVPALFPDNAALRIRESPSTPTNRNFPAPGQGLSPSLSPLDALGRPILPENLALMSLIERFQPSRIATVHATVREGAAGVFSDAHTVGEGASPAEILDAQARSSADEALAIEMATTIAEAGQPNAVAGNDLANNPNAQWSGGVDGGTSLGGWGPRAIAEGGPGDRPSISILTVEVAQQHRSDDLTGEEALRRRAEILAYTDAIRDVFLED